MKFILLILFLFSACSSLEPAKPAASAVVGPSPTVTSVPSPSATPSPTPTPTPTPQPIVTPTPLPLSCPLPGDYDRDNDVDGNDYLVWQREFGKVWSKADGNKDYSVDAADYVIWRKYFGQTHNCPPEPTTMAGSIDALVKGKPAPTSENFYPFATYTATGCQANLQVTINQNFWAKDVNLSPIAWHDNAGWGDPRVCGPTLGRGVAITKRHVIAHHQHGTEAPGYKLQFVRKNGEIKTVQTAWEYETDGGCPDATKPWVCYGNWRILWLEEDLPEDLIAPFPAKDSQIMGKPIAVGANGYGLVHIRLNWVNNQTQNYSWVPVNAGLDPDPVRQLYRGGGIGGDSGKPLFAIIGLEMVPLSVWWTPGGGSSMVFDHDAIIVALDRLSTRKGDSRMLKPREIFVQ